MTDFPRENVQSYPRPPALEPVLQRIIIWLGGAVVADTTRALCVKETHHAPNRGAFIQMRLGLPTALPEATTGLRLIVRGNTQRYFVHLRSGGSLPWQYQQAGFDVTEGWDEVRLPLATFAPSSGFEGPIRSADRLTSVAVAAYGRDHDARIDVREVEFTCPDHAAEDATSDER